MTHRFTRRARRTLVAATVVGAVVVSSGCGLTVEKLPLPKPGQAGDTYTVHAVFANALNLPEQAKVKVGGSDVGVVSRIETENFRASVDLTIRKDIELPKGSTAELRQATPLGDVFVAVSKPKVEPGTSMMHSGDTIGIEQTSAGATVEELLLAISLLLNGGGVASLSELGTELDSIVGGRGERVAHLIAEMTGVVGSLNDNSTRIDGVLDGFDTLASTVEARHHDLGQVAESLPQMIGTIAENNQALGDLLQKVAITSVALGDYAHTSGEQLSSLLDNTEKLMQALADTGDNFGAAMDALSEIRPAVDATFEGKSLAAYVNVTNLDIALLTAPGTSKFFDLRDLQDFGGSLIQVLQILYGRLTGGHR